MTTTYRSHQVTTPNADLPVELETARQHLRMDELTVDDPYIMDTLKACADYVETVYGLALLTKTIKEYHAGFPCSDSEPIILRIAPVASITIVEYVDTYGTVQVWDASNYTFGGFNGAVFLVPKDGKEWPTSQTLPNSVTITYIAGFGAAPTNVPVNVRRALLLMVGYMFSNREDEVLRLPRASELLLLPYYRFKS